MTEEFFQKNWKPLRYVTVAPSDQPVLGGKKFSATCEKISWGGAKGSSLLCTCSDQTIREVDLTELYEGMDSLPEHFESFEAFYPITELFVKLPVPVVLSPSHSKANLAANTVSTTKEKVEEDGGSDTKEESLEASTSSPSKGSSDEVLMTYVPSKVYGAVYSKGRKVPSVVASTFLNGKFQLVETTFSDSEPPKELKIGLHSADGKDLPKSPQVSCLEYSKGKKFMLMGTSDGTIVIRPNDFLETFLRVVTNSGAVTCAASSFDDAYVLSAGKDGILSVLKIAHEQSLTSAEVLWKDLDAGVFADAITKELPKPGYVEPASLTSVMLPSAAEIKVELKVQPLDDAEDIKASVYSIEDSKLKTGDDEKKVLAEEKKADVRKMIASLRAEFDEILAKNQSIPPSVRLSPEELVVDQELVDMLTEEGLEMVDEVRKLCAYEAEKADALRRKLLDRLMGNVLVEEIPLFGFSLPPGFPPEDCSSGCLPSRPVVAMQAVRPRPSYVSSLRAKAMDSVISEVLESVRAQVKKEAVLAAKARSAEAAKLNAEASVAEAQHRIRKDGLDFAAVGGGSTVESKPRGTSSAVRSELRKERKLKLKEHMAKKPKEDADDVRDVEAIMHAERTIGDYKLKSGDEYVVPADQQTTADKKKRQMVLLEESMIVLRLKFNERFLALRYLKKQLVESVGRSNERIRSIDEVISVILTSVQYSLGDSTSINLEP